MSTITRLFEAATLASESASEDGTWKVRLISEGKGSSGVYTKELLENHHHAFDNVLSFKNHPTGWDGPQSRDFTMIAGEIVGETWIEADERGLTAVYGNYLPDTEFKDKIERYKGKLGLSIFIEGSGYLDEDSGEFYIDWFNPEDPYASVDVVIAPGARGRFGESAMFEDMRKFYTSAIEGVKKDSVTVAENENRSTIVEEKIDKILEALTALTTHLQEKAVVEAQADADAKAVEVAVEQYDAAVKAVEKADLFKSQRDAILAEAKAGRDVEALIESAVKVKEEALDAVKVKESQEDAPGVVLGESVKRYGAWA